MKIRPLVFLLWAVPVLTACAEPKASPTVSPEVEQFNAGQEFAKSILDSWRGSTGWVPPLPPMGGEIPRTLTEAEKARVMEIACAIPQVVETRQHKGIVSVDTQYLWVGWEGHPDGVSYLGYLAVENRQASQSALTTMGDNCYPAVDFIFNSTFGEYGKAGIHVAVNLQTGKAVYLGGFIASAIPRRLPPRE